MPIRRIALIGCGSRAPSHIAGWAGVPDTEVVACCAPSPGRRDDLARRFGLTAYADPAEMIRRERPDVIQIVTQPGLRVGLLTLVSDLGVPACTVEKPIAIGTDDWRDLVALGRTSRTRIAVCHQFRWHPDLVRCREALTPGGLGPVRFLEMSAGMCVGNQGTHVLDYGMSLIGDSPVTRVFAGTSGWQGTDVTHPSPDEVIAHLDFANGVRGLWQCGVTAPRCGDPATIWQHVRVSAQADRGRATWEEFGQTAIIGPDGPDLRLHGGWDAWHAGNLAAQTGFHQAVVGWLDGGSAPGTALGNALHQWKVVLAAAASADLRRPITISDFTP